MFYDEFARSDRSFLWQWYRMEIVFDEAGNGVIADSVLNTVVKFEAITAAGDDSTMRVIWPVPFCPAR